MNKNLLVGTLSFALLSFLLGLVVPAVLELIGASSAFAIQAGACLIATPAALVVARRIGTVTRLSVLLASVAVTLVSLWAVVFILNAMAEPVGGSFGWTRLFNTMDWRNAVGTIALPLAVPQLWLSVLRYLDVEKTSKPTPLRGAA